MGRGLSKSLNKIYGRNNLILTDISDPLPEDKPLGMFLKLDVTEKENFANFVKEHKITNIIHLASLLSASCEKNLDLAQKINIQGLHNALKIAKDFKTQIFIPSTIATFGPNLEKRPLPDDVVQDPITYYGISKIYMEKLGAYYYNKFGVDFRSLRYPAIISPYEFACNGTATYPTELIHSALKAQKYKMYLEPHIKLPMMYIDDCIRGTIEFIGANNLNLTRRTYNFNGLSFSPEEYLAEVKKVLQVDVEYEIDNLRNRIALTWPVSLDDKIATRDWGWKPNVSNTKELVDIMVRDTQQTH